MAPNCPPRAPLVLLPLVKVPFVWVAVDIMGLLLRNNVGHQYILVLMDYETRYPEAAPKVAEELLKIFSRVGIPKELLTNQGTNVMSRVLEGVIETLGTHKDLSVPPS